MIDLKSIYNFFLMGVNLNNFFLKKNGERKENVFFPAAVQDRR